MGWVCHFSLSCKLEIFVKRDHCTALGRAAPKLEILDGYVSKLVG